MRRHAASAADSTVLLLAPLFGRESWWPKVRPGGLVTGGTVGRAAGIALRTRAGSGGINARDVGIDDGDELQRAREIRDELRSRSGQRQRPEIERDYINRLLRKF